MGRVVRLVTTVERRDDGRVRREGSASARLEVGLEDGRRVVVLDDRGWSGRVNADVDYWAHEPVEQIEREARIVVGPDEPLDGMSYEEAEAQYWAYLVDILARRGVDVTPGTLRSLSHDVVLGPRLAEALALGGKENGGG